MSVEENYNMFSPCTFPLCYRDEELDSHLMRDFAIEMRIRNFDDVKGLA